MKKVNSPKVQSLVSTSDKAVIYCRVASSHPSDIGAMGVQLGELRDFVKQKGFNVSMEYLDDGFNGNNLDTPAFMQMEEAINSGQIDTVIVRCVNRIARNVILLNCWISEVGVKGVSLIASDSHEHSVIPFKLGVNI